PMLSDRLTRGVELYQAGWADKLLMSGDNRSQDYNELATMHRVALEKGVPQADVVLDYAGLSTYDSLYRARDIFGVKKVVIVTQEYHMYRALYLARALGLEAWGVAADGQNYRGQTMRDLREILARDKDVLWAIFQPEPTYLGDPEPLTGTP
ncbi:vancomycin high temperature exclusion protein, partial [Evtepia gabavorous]